MTHIKTRYDTLAAWTSVNPVLLAGERGEESDTERAKVGDGVTAWNDLPYVSAPFASAALTGTPTAPTADHGTNTTQIATTQFVQTELAPKADLSSPVFTGDPKAPTPGDGDNDTSIATTEWVNTAIAEAIAALPGTDPLAAYPIDSIYMSVREDNPSTYLGGGTWVAWGAGRVPVGFDDSQSEFDTVEGVGGVKEVTLTTAQLPSHTHNMNHGHSNPSSSSLGTAAYIARGLAADSLGVIGATNPFTGNTGAAGSGQAHTNLQPYLVCYMWKRIA